MKTIGIIGGIGVPSTIKYYQLLNESIKKELGDENSVQVIINSLNGNNIKNFRMKNDKVGEREFFIQEAKRLEMAGVDFLLIASNTSHRNASYIEQALSIPLIHLADATVECVVSKNIKKVGFLSTSTLINESFYLDKFLNASIEVILPNEGDRVYIDNEIYSFLIKNVVRPQAKRRFADIINKMKLQGVSGVILGCTDFTLLNLKSTAEFPLFDTVNIHVKKAISEILK